MSVSVSAVPFMLVFALSKGIIDVTGAVVSGLSNTQGQKLHLEGKELEEIFNKSFNTSIMDKSVLIKTLSEHGATNIMDESGVVSCDCESFHLVFQKVGYNRPYAMTASFNKDYGLNELVNDIGSEYATNAQEISYNKIKERLEQKNLEIEDEEIYDDNTIVLTVNLE